MIGWLHEPISDQFITTFGKINQVRKASSIHNTLWKTSMTKAVKIWSDQIVR